MVYKIAKIFFLIMLTVLITIAAAISIDIPFVIEELNIDVPMRISLFGKMAQDNIDLENCGAYYDKIVADHNTQGFSRLSEADIGTRAIFGRHEYSCIFKMKGYSVEGIRPLTDDYRIYDADLYAITCTGEQAYEVWIIGFEKVD